MNFYIISVISIAFSFLFILLPSFAFSKKLPVIEGKEVVAMVNNEPITLEEYNRALSLIHSEKAEERQAGSIDYKGILDRLINLRLIVQEAKAIGLNEFPEVKSMMESYSNSTLVGILRGNHVKELKADEEELDKLYKEAVKELKLKSVLFETEKDAKKFEGKIKAGADFDETAQKAVTDGTAKGSIDSRYVKGQSLLPKALEASSQMSIGSVSPPINVKQGYVIFKLEDIRFPEDLEAKELARQKALDFKRELSLEQYKESLIKKYIKINEDILSDIDYELSTEEFEKLLDDKRVIAEIKGEQPVTVAELTKSLKKKYFHGVEIAIRDRKLNSKKREYLYDSILQKRVYVKEALNQGIEKTAAYKNIMREHENSTLFDQFVRKVIIPDIKLGNEELQSYYNENISRYSYPGMMRISSIAFGRKENADSALNKLKNGTDFKWLSANADGILDAETKGVLKFDGKMIMKEELPEGIQKITSGANTGDIKLYTSPEPYYYLLFIEDILPSTPIPFEEVKKQITEKVFSDKIDVSLKEWSDKLRDHYDVDIYATEF